MKERLNSGGDEMQTDLLKEAETIDSAFHEIFMNKLQDGFRIDHMEMQAHIMLWNILPKYYPKSNDEIRIYPQPL
ncbi:hypothetical protein [[Eubacterium] hominis]|uniref:hypothetical protein n=1 Tax=[Eubacterium] hominis TaxID=2764325 RepID=UPI003A4E20CB